MSSMLPRLANTPFKLLTSFCVILLFFAALALYFLPALISSSWAHDKVVGLINSRIAGQISFKTLELHWFGAQKVDELVLKDPEGEVIISIPHAEIDTSLTNLLWNYASAPAKLKLQGANGKITRTSTGESNLHRALNIQADPALAAAEPFFIQFANMSALLDINSSHPSYKVEISGEVQSSGEKGKIELHALLQDGTLPDNLEAKLIHFPLPLIEEVIALFQPKVGHHLSNLLGSTIDLELKHTKESQGDRLQLKGTTPEWDFDLKGLLTTNNTDIHLDDIQAAISAKKLRSGSLASLTGKLSASVHLDGIIDHDQLNFQNTTVVAKTHLEQFPTALLAQLLPLDKDHAKKLEALIGPEFGFNGTAALKDMKGPVVLELHGTNSTVHVDFQLHDHLVTLNKPLHAEFKVTPALSQEILEDLVPILGGMISAENPVKLTIDTQGFAYPIYSNNFHAAEVGNMTLQLGKVYFNREGQFGKIASLLNTKTQEDISVWFTPVYLHMKNAKIEVKRFDMLVTGKYPLATWGNVDFIKNRIDFIIGLSGKSLEGYVKVPVLPENALIQVPYKGKIGKASVDKTKVAAQIAALVSASSGTPQGLGLGALLGLAAGSFNEAPPPEPTTQPFPWDNGK